MTLIEGTDVSAAQGPSLDWSAIAATDVRFAICKSTESTGYVDRTFSRNASCARAAGLAVGAYHFFRAERDPEQQAKSFHDVASGAVDLPPVLDFESLHGVAPAEAAARAIAFVAATEEFWQRRCIVYSYVSFVQQLGRVAFAPLADRPLWVAHYGVQSPTVPLPWEAWTLWQYDGDGGRKLPGGVDADFDRLAVDIPTLISACDLRATHERPAAPSSPAHPLGDADRAEQEARDAADR